MVLQAEEEEAVSRSLIRECDLRITILPLSHSNTMLSASKQLFAGLVLLSLSAAGRGETLQSVTSTFYPNASKALKAKDFKAFRSLYLSRIAPKFVYQEKTGQNFDFKKMMSIVTADVTMPKTLDTAESIVHTMRDKGDHGLVIVWHKIRGTVIGNDKVRHALFIEGTSQDTWKKTGDRWMLERSAFIMHRYSLDGKGFGISANDR